MADGEGIPLGRGAVRAADMVAVETGRLLALDLVAFLLWISSVYADPGVIDEQSLQMAWAWTLLLANGPWID